MSAFSLPFSLSLSSLFTPLHQFIVMWLVVHLSPHLSRNNLAEKFFAEMTEKDGGTYDALIQGLIKVEQLIHNSIYTKCVPEVLIC